MHGKLQLEDLTSSASYRAEACAQSEVLGKKDLFLVHLNRGLRFTAATARIQSFCSWEIGVDTRLTYSSKNRKEGKPVVVSPGPRWGGEHAGGNRPEAFGLGLGTNEKANEEAEGQI